MLLTMGEIDLDGPEAIFKQLAKVLAARIAKGTYEVNRRIPSEAELREEFGVGRTTARAAVTLLVEQGLVEPRQGKGVYVLPKSEDQAEPS
jgi:GntR family transcriptional regulator